MNTYAIKTVAVVAISASALTFSPTTVKSPALYPAPDTARGANASGAVSSGSKIEVSVRAATNKAAVVRGTQDYYWTAAWQREERTAMEELNQGEYLDFDSADDLIAWLNESDE